MEHRNGSTLFLCPPIYIIRCPPRPAPKAPPPRPRRHQGQDPGRKAPPPRFASAPRPLAPLASPRPSNSAAFSVGTRFASALLPACVRAPALARACPPAHARARAGISKNELSPSHPRRKALKTRRFRPFLPRRNLHASFTSLHPASFIPPRQKSLTVSPKTLTVFLQTLTVSPKMLTLRGCLVPRPGAAAPLPCRGGVRGGVGN